MLTYLRGLLISIGERRQEAPIALYLLIKLSHGPLIQAIDRLRSASLYDIYLVL